MSAQSQFSELIALLAPYQLGAAFPPPAHESELQELESLAGHALPSGLVSMWRLHDGGPAASVDPTVACLFYSYLFMSAREAMQVAHGMDEILKPENMPALDQPIPSFPEGTVEGALYRPATAWLPFAKDLAGGYLAIDFSPGPNGCIGQVINFGRDDFAHFQLGTSVEAFLQRVLIDYKNKRMHHVFGERMMYVDRLLMTQQENGGRVWFNVPF